MAVRFARPASHRATRHAPAARQRHDTQSAQPTADPFARAVMLHGAGQVQQAYELYQGLLRSQAGDARLLELAGIASLQLSRPAEAVEQLEAAIHAGAQNSSIYRNLGASLEQIGKTGQAVRALRTALDLQPDNVESLVVMGTLLERMGEPDEAARTWLKALSFGEDEPPQALIGLRRLLSSSPIAPRIRLMIARHGGAAARHLADPMSAQLPGEAARALAAGRYAAAIEALTTYLMADGRNAAAWTNLGLAYRAAGDCTAAEAAINQAIQEDSTFAAAWNNLAVCLLDRGDVAQASDAVNRALALAPGMANAHSNRGMILRKAHDAAGAMNCYARAAQLDPRLFEAHLNLGNLLYEHGQEGQALGCFERAQALNPESAEAYYSIGVTQPEPELALGALDRALRQRRQYPEAEMAQVFTQLKGCQWSGLETRLAHVETMARDPAVAPLSPFWMLALSGSRQTQLLTARKWAAGKMHATPGAPLRRGQRAASGKVRIGFISGDLRDHAVGQLLGSVLPSLRQGACELYGYDVSPDDGSALRHTLRQAFHQLRDVALLSLPALAQVMADDALDVLVDLSGYSQHSRSGVLAWRPAPMQVSYLGFPGSMGWNQVDALIADDYLVPPSHAADYDERVVRLPCCYQPARRFDLPAPSTRAAAGLPNEGLVMACFANSYKLRPQIFDCWLRLLKARPDSVLWLARYNATMARNLGAYAREHGVQPDRLVFAPMLPLAEHMARLSLADLCLDTAPYGSGVTATQALYAGVPLLTLAGSTYVGRMAASVLHALGLPSLIAEDLDAYEAQALRLTQESQPLIRLRQQLADARASSPVFDIERSARDFELAMRRLAGEGRHLPIENKEEHT